MTHETDVIPRSKLYDKIWLISIWGPGSSLAYIQMNKTIGRVKDLPLHNAQKEKQSRKCNEEKNADVLYEN